MDERKRRSAENEALFRHVNERIEDVNRAFSAITDRIDVICECGRTDCTERIALGIADYERVRTDATQFVLVPGHEDLDVEHVVERHDAWLVVRKDPGLPAAYARETAPRGD